MPSEETIRWQVAHQNLKVLEEALETAGPFPSLYANDFYHYLEGRGNSAEVLSFVKALIRELVWAYDGWAQAQRDSKAEALIDDMLNCSLQGGGEYAFVQRFLRDYAKANNISLKPIGQQDQSWQGILPVGSKLT